MKLIKAIEYATRAHAGQVRKSDNMPYISHPVSVMAIVAEHGADDATKIGALLHDVVEDTPISLDDIEAEFGATVRAVVREVTEVGSEGEVKASWEDRKQASIDALPHKSYRGLMITAADKLHNVQGLVTMLAKDGESTWDKFARGKGKQVWVYSTLASVIQEEASKRFAGSALESLAASLVAEVAKLR